MRELTLVIVAKTEPLPSATMKVTAILNCTREHNSRRNISAGTQPCAEITHTGPLGTVWASDIQERLNPN